MSWQVYVGALLLAVGPVRGDTDAAWTTDYAAARGEAARRRVPIVMAFCGSDWSAASKRLRDEVWGQAAFRALVGTRAVLMRVDFPQDAVQSSAMVLQNWRLLTRYGVRQLPTVVVVDAAGAELARGFYRGEGAGAFLRRLAAWLEPKASPVAGDGDVDG